MTIGSISAGSHGAVGALQPQVQAALQLLQQSGTAAGGGSAAAGGTSSSSSVEVSQTSTVLATGVITTVITYANGQTETTVSYGPPPASTFSVLA